MKKIRELLKEKRIRWTAGGILCLLTGAMIFALWSEIGVKAVEISLGTDTVNLQPVDGEENTYWVENASQLQKLGNAASGTAGLTFRLKNDITVGNVSAAATGHFEGVLDGDGHVIVYEDVNIVVTDENPSSDSVANGLLFGNLSGTVQDLIVDIQDTDASYTRKTKNPYNESVGSPVFAEEQNPIIGENEVVSGLDTDKDVLAKVNEIYELETVPGTEYKSHTLSEAGTVTTTYTSGDSAEDYFGLICGKSTGTIQEVFLTGNSVAIQREELASLDYAQSVQSGHREETYYYLQETETVTGEGEKVSLSIDGNVYAGNKTYTDSLENNELLLSVSAPKAMAKGGNIVYTVKIENQGNEDYTKVKLTATKNGKWSQRVQNQKIEAGESLEVQFTYNAANASEDQISIDFTVEGTSGETTASVTVSDVQTVLFDAAEADAKSSAQGLKLDVSAPVIVGADDGIAYTVAVTNNADEAQKVVLESVLSGTWKEGEGDSEIEVDPKFELAKGETKTLTFYYETSGLTSTEVTAEFYATATTETAMGSAKAVVQDLKTQLFESASESAESSVKDLNLKVTAPQKKGVNGTGDITYEILISNTGDADYTGLQLTASKEGIWNGSGSANTAFDVSEMKSGDSQSITFTYSSTEDDMEQTQVSMDFAVSGSADGTEVTVEVSEAVTQLVDISSKTKKTSETGLEVQVQAPEMIKKGETIEYLVTVTNTSDQDYAEVILAADGEGTWNDSATFSLEKNISKTLTYSQTASSDGSDPIVLNFTVTGAITAGTDPDITAEVSDVTTELFTEENISNEKNADGLTVQVVAPQQKAAEWNRDIEYKVIVTNNSAEDYTGIVLNASKEGKWNGNLFSSTNYEKIETISAGTSQEITYVYSCVVGDLTTKKVSIDFTVSGETAATKVNAAVSDVVTELLTEGGTTGEETVQGLELNVSAPKFAVKGDKLTYTVTIKNKGNKEYQKVQLESDGTGSWSKSELSSLAVNGWETVTYTQNTDTGAADEIVLNFSAVGTNDDTAESVKATVSDVTTTLYDAGNETKACGVQEMELRISAPQVLKKGENQQIAYEITVKNKSSVDYTNVSLTSSEAGKWNGAEDESVSYEIGSITAGASVSVTFSCSNTANEVSLKFSAEGTAAGATAKIVVSGVETQLLEEEEAEKTAETDNGLKATLEIADKNVIAGSGENFLYTLTLENTNELSANFILSRNLGISENLSDAGWTIESSTAPEFSLGSTGQVIPAGEKVVLTKEVTPQADGDESSTACTETIDLTAVLTSTGYQYSYDKTQSTPDSDVFIADQEAPQTSGDPVVSGNVLYAGGIAGKSMGTVSQVKQSVDLEGTELSGKFSIGGIAGAAENADSWSDIYMLGTVNGTSKYDGAGSASPSTSATVQQTSAPGSQWTVYTKYSSTGTQKETFADLAWLVKTENTSDAYFSYTEPENQKITVTLQEEKKLTSQALSFSIAYNARKSMQDTKEDTVYVSENENIDLGNSGYYRLLSTYATDGYYHYQSQAVELKNAVWIYPYNEDTNVNPCLLNGQQVVRQSSNPMEDKVLITLSSQVSGEIYYNINTSNEVPNTSEGSNTVQTVLDANGTAQLPFEVDRVQFRIVPVADGHIYPMLTTKEFSQDDKEPIPKPLVTCYNYYDAAGNIKEYVAFGADSYEAGTDMVLMPAETEATDENYSFRYIYSTIEPDAAEWNEEQRYTGNGTTLMDQAVDYAESAVIPTDFAGEENVYLYVEVSKKNYASQIYYYGPFDVRETAELTAAVTSNGEISEGYGVLEGDIVSISGEPAGSTIQYMVSTGPESSYVWADYPADGIVMKPESGGYIYARIKYDDTTYGGVTLFDYTFGGICADPRVTPNTGISSGGEVAAATIGSNTAVTLSSRTPTAELFCLVSDTSQSMTLERASVVPSDVSADGDIGSDGYKYFKVGNRWYRTVFTETKRYTEELLLTHDKKEAQLVYVSAVALADGYEPSSVVEYIYKVQPTQQVENPEAAVETRYIPGGENIEIASVKLGANISFFSVTPDAELYYAIGTGTEAPASPIPNDGITVEGTYGKNFVVRVQAKKEGMQDSDIITFIYVISDQESVNAPTATPGTTEDVPTTVIPGNKILLSTTTKGASIFYTTDGSSPEITENSDGTYTAANDKTFLYSTTGIVMPLDGSGYFSITAIAVKSGLAKSTEVHFTYAYPGAVLAPYANRDSGNVELNTVIYLKNLTEGAVIYYNVAYGDAVPADPTLSSTVFSETYPFTITQKTTIKAMAAKDGVKSQIVTFVYTPMGQLAPPEASIESGSVVSRGTVLKLSAAEGATIYYTMDGSDPTDSTNTAVMSGTTLTLNGEPGGQVTIKAYAAASNKSRSEVVTFTYQFSKNTGGVTASIASGSVVSDKTKVNLMTDVTGAEIYYTIDGSSPAENGIKGTIVEITGKPGSSFTIKAVAVVDGEPGIMATFIYRIKEIPDAPTASPSGGMLTVATRVTLNSSEEKIYYTTDGTEPTKSSTPYTEPILINRTTTLKAIAVSEDGEISKVATFIYTAAQKAAKVVSTNADGSVLKPGDTIQLSTATSNAVIYYSTDGTEPSLDNLESMLVYDGDSIEINRSVTIQAVAYREDLRLSEVSVWNYTVDVIPAVEQKKAEEAKEAEEGLRDTDASKLSRSNEQADRKVTKKLWEKEYDTLVSYAENVFPSGIELVTVKEAQDVYTNEKAKKMFGESKKVLENYRLKVKNGTTGVQPTEEVEVAFPIPEGYEDAALSVVLLGEDYELTALETRREDNMLYAKTSKIGSYVIIGPERGADIQSQFPYLLVLEGAAGLTLLIGVIYYTKEKIKKYLKNR